MSVEENKAVARRWNEEIINGQKLEAFEQVLHKDYVETAQKQITTDYENRIAALEGKQEQLMEVITRLISVAPQPTIGELIIGDKSMIQAGRETPLGQDYSERLGYKVTDISQIHTREDLQNHYELLSENLSELRKKYILETDPDVKFKIKKNIEEAEANLKKIEQRVEELESKGDRS